MAVLAVQEAVYRALETALAAGVSDVPRERNRRSLLDNADEAPRLVLRDGGMRPSPDEAFGLDLLTVSALLEGYVTGADADLGPRLADLHARAVVALCGDETDPGRVLTTAGGLEITVAEGAADLDFVLVGESDAPLAAFYLDLTVTLRVAVGQRFVTTP